MNPLSLLSPIPDALQSAQTGVARGMAALNSDAQTVALSVSGTDPTSALIDSQQQLLSVEASVAVLKGTDQMLGSLIDVIA